MAKGDARLRAKEFLTEQAVDDLEPLREACENWMNMYFETSDLKTILNHPYSQKFKKPPAGIQQLYRGLIVKNRQLKSIKAKTNRTFMAFATEPEGAEEFIRSLDLPDEREIIIAKEFHPGDFLLDFTGLYESIFPHVHQNMYYNSEYEVWMRATPYYISVDEKEIIQDTQW
jgi:hypothetical protein